MSALKSDFIPLFLYEVSKLDEPWKTILSQLDNISVDDVMSKIGTTSLIVSGVYVKGVQCTFEKIAERMDRTDVSHLFYVLYGIVMSCVTGNVYPTLSHYMRPEWCAWLFQVRVDGEPVFVLACRRSLKTFVEWMVQQMNAAKEWSACCALDLDGNSPLHFAVKRRQWDWAKWLMAQGVSPYTKNNAGESSVMLVAPYHDRLGMFCTEKNKQWFDALHDALVYGREDSTWCVSLLDQGADVNQLALYDAPLDSLVVFAKHGMDMNLGPLPENTLADKLKVFFVYGRKPVRWERVIQAFDDATWTYSLHAFFNGMSDTLKEEYISNVNNMRAITTTSIDIVERCKSLSIQ